MRFRARLVPILWAGDLGISAVALGAFLAQGGFGAGHGPLDQVIFSLALPWALVPWPHSLIEHDLVWLVVLPFVLNSILVAIVHLVVVLRARHQHRPAGHMGASSSTRSTP